MQTKVIHIRDANAGPNGNWWFGPKRGKEQPENMVYIGRSGRGMDGPLGNPFTMNSEKDRDYVIQKYAQYAITRARMDPEFRKLVASLRGKTLVCFCAPKPCHGDVLAQLAEELQ